MEGFSRFIVKYRKAIIIAALLLLIPSVIGYLKTRVNYDILVYLPDDVETIEGQNILKNEFDMGAYAFVLLENMNTKEIATFEKELKQLDNVAMALSITDLTGDTYPLEMLPDDIYEKVVKNNSTIMFVTFKEGISDDETLETVRQIRNIADERIFISGMSAVVVDTKDLSDEEVLTYVLVAAGLCMIILQLALDSYFVPILMLINIGLAVVYNMGTNCFLGETSYITKAISSVLQLGVTMDFSIFLYHSYCQEREKENDIKKAMEIAIQKTIVSVLGSSLTTFAGFLALCSMRLTLGTDIGIVMAKGVAFGLLTAIVVLPPMILECNKIIEKTKHKVVMPKFRHIKEYAIKYRFVILILFIIILPFAYYGYSNTKVYYNLDSSLPDYLPSITANNKLEKDFEMVATEVVLIDSSLDDSKVNEMLDKIENLDGIEWAAGLSRISETSIPKDAIPTDILEKIQNDKYQLLIINSTYGIATDELNDQIVKINDIIKSYDEDAILAGVGPLMKDLVVISDHDFKSVNTISIAVIFIIMVFVLKSISLPIILIATIEFAIFINMGIPYYTNTVIPFIASIVIGTIQLGATIDYAILITTKYISKRKEGNDKGEAIDYALGTSISSIFVSGLCFFGATFGVGIVSKLEMIASLCAIMARGAIVSMLVVVIVLPSFLMLFDKIICKTTKGLSKVNN